MHEGHRKRLKQRYTLAGGLETFHHHEILEFLLTFAIPRRDTNELAHSLIDYFGSFSAVFEANKTELMKVPGVGENAATLIKLITDVNRTYLIDALGEKPKLDSLKKQVEYCAKLHYARAYETIYAVCLNVKKHVVGTFLLDEGSLVEASVSLTKLLERVMAAKAHSVLLTHNHPGGLPNASKNDVLQTHVMARALRALEINFEDHIIIGDGNEWQSLKESGVI